MEADRQVQVRPRDEAEESQGQQYGAGSYICKSRNPCGQSSVTGMP
jgi:hypothetical protein